MIFSFFKVVRGKVGLIPLFLNYFIAVLVILIGSHVTPHLLEIPFWLKACLLGEFLTKFEILYPLYVIWGRKMYAALSYVTENRPFAREFFLGPFGYEPESKLKKT